MPTISDGETTAIAWVAEIRGVPDRAQESILPASHSHVMSAPATGEET